jgi:hypothetical protein
MVRSGVLFKEVLRYMMTPIVLARAVPLLAYYARANYAGGDLPPDFEERLEASGLTIKDLVHLDFAISIGYAESSGNDAPEVGPVPAMEWTSTDLHNILFAYVDIPGSRSSAPLLRSDDEDDDGPDEDGGGPGTRFDL